MAKKANVLFLSAGNPTRSLMAEGFLRKLGGDRFEAASVGTENSHVDPSAVETMAEIGIDISAQRPKKVKECLQEHFSYVVAVCDPRGRESSCLSFHNESLAMDSIRSFAHRRIARGTTGAFRSARDDIRSNVEVFLANTERQEKERETRAKAPR